MATATVHIENVEGFAGPARCFKLDPPQMLGDIQCDYVTVWTQSAYGQFTRPETCLIPATESGAAAPMFPGGPPSLIRQPGSFVMHDDPDTPAIIDGAYALALLMLGGYTVTDPVVP